MEDRFGRARERVQPGHKGDRGRMESATGHDHSFEPFLQARVTDEPSGIVSPEEFDTNAEPDARRKAERVGIAMQVVENLTA